MHPLGGWVILHPRVLARVRVVLSRSVITYSTPILPLAAVAGKCRGGKVPDYRVIEALFDPQL
jgi:hypothetical protein